MQDYYIKSFKKQKNGVFLEKLYYKYIENLACDTLFILKNRKFIVLLQYRIWKNKFFYCNCINILWHNTKKRNE